MKYLLLVFLMFIFSCGHRSVIKNFNYGQYSELNKDKLFYKEHRIKEMIAYSYEIPYDTIITLNGVEKDLAFFRDSIMYYDNKGYLITQEHIFNSQSYNTYLSYNDRGRLIKIRGGEEGEFKYSEYGNLEQSPDYILHYGKGDIIIESQEVDFSYSITGVKRPRITIIYIFDENGRPRFRYSRDYHKFEYYEYSEFEYDINGELLKEKCIYYCTDDMYVGDRILRPENWIKNYKEGKLIKESKEKPGRYRYTHDHIYSNGIKVKQIDSSIYFRSGSIETDYTDYVYNSNKELVKTITYHMEELDTIVSAYTFFEYKYY